MLLSICPLCSSTAGSYEDAAAADHQGNYATALALLRPLAEHGDARAQYAIGYMTLQGHGVAQDDSEANQWLKRSADQGYGPAQFRLGMNYAGGTQSPPDRVQAYVWLSLSVEYLSTDEAGAKEEATFTRDKEARLMSPTALDSAQELVRKWKQEHPVVNQAPSRK
jgi:TPR repeat protein